MITRQNSGTEEAEMQILGVDLHTRQQTIAMLNVETGETVEEDSTACEGDSTARVLL